MTLCTISSLVSRRFSLGSCITNLFRVLFTEVQLLEERRRPKVPAKAPRVPLPFAGTPLHFAFGRFFIFSPLEALFAINITKFDQLLTWGGPQAGQVAK